MLIVYTYLLFVVQLYLYIFVLFIDLVCVWHGFWCEVCESYRSPWENMQLCSKEFYLVWTILKDGENFKDNVGIGKHLGSRNISQIFLQSSYFICQ